jgi:hypothetical protein
MSPQIDVSAVLGNPMFLDTFTVLRRKQIVNQFGEATMSVRCFTGVRGVVQPEGLNDLSRRPEAQTNAKTLVIYTRFAIRGESKDANVDSEFQPDQVVWYGNTFVVVRVEDWSKYARGYVKVTAASQDIVDQATTARPLSETNEKVAQ